MKRLVLFAAVLLVAPLAAAAQSPDDVWWGRVAEQNALNLADTESHVQAQALKNTIYLATFYRDRLDLADSVAPIRALCGHKVTPEVKRLAVAALHAIGSYDARDYLARHVSPEEADEARGLIAEVLNEQFRRQRLSAL